MEATIVYWGYTGIMENRMEATMKPMFRRRVIGMV